MDPRDKNLTWSNVLLWEACKSGAASDSDPRSLRLQLIRAIWLMRDLTSRDQMLHCRVNYTNGPQSLHYFSIWSLTF